MLKEDKSVDSSWKRRWYWNFGTLQKSTRCSETANCSKTWILEKNLSGKSEKTFVIFLEDWRKEVQTDTCNSKFWTLLFFISTYPWNWILHSSFSSKLIIVLFSQHSQFCNENLRKPLSENSSFCRWRKKGSEMQFQHQFGCDKCRVTVLNICFLSRNEINYTWTKGLEFSSRGKPGLFSSTFKTLLVVMLDCTLSILKKGRKLFLEKFRFVLNFLRRSRFLVQLKFVRTGNWRIL